MGRGAPAPRLGLGRAGVINRWKMGADFVLGAEEVNIPEIQFRSVVEALQERSLKMRKKSMDIGEGLPLPPASPAQPRERDPALRPATYKDAVDGERSEALDEIEALEKSCWSEAARSFADGFVYP